VEAGLDAQMNIVGVAQPGLQDGEWRTHGRWRGDNASSEAAEARAMTAFGEAAGEGTFLLTPYARCGCGPGQFTSRPSEL
jgi:hypothetical protein